MAGYQTIEALRPIMHRGPVAMPVVSRELVRPLTERQKRIALIRELRSSGMTQYAIADQVGVSRGTVQRATADLAPPPGGWPVVVRETTFNRAKAQRMRRAGFTYAEIAEDLGCSESNAFRIVNRVKWKGTGRNRPTRKYEEMVSRATGIRMADLHANPNNEERAAGSPKARSILYWLIRAREPGLSLPQIGRYLGGFHHTTILHGSVRCRQVAEAVGIVLTHPRSGGMACRQLWEMDWSEVAQ